jgi:hypothetical protein
MFGKARLFIYLASVIGCTLCLSPGASADSTNSGSSKQTNNSLQTPRAIAAMSPQLQLPIFRKANPGVPPQVSPRVSPPKVIPLRPTASQPASSAPAALTPASLTPAHSTPALPSPTTSTPRPSAPAQSTKPQTPTATIPKLPTPPSKPAAHQTSHLQHAQAPRPQIKSENNWLALYQLGQTLYGQGKYTDAYKVWKESLESANKGKVWLEMSGLQQIDTLKKLAMMHKTQSEPAQAAQKYNLAISTAVKCAGPESQLVADLMLEQGRLYTFNYQTANIARANEMLNESFRINEKLHGRFTIPTGDVAMAIAQLKEKENKFSEALSYWQLTIDIGDRLEPDIVSCCRIGPRQGKIRCLEALGKTADAENAHKDLIAMCRKGAPNMMPTVLDSYASFLRDTGQPAQSK